uniref:G-protein coupled receptors family 2 profile 2 domain-containing protein n=1 Tax=Entomoneis paludosa TaxID=265537 RepID=A0A7S2VCR2_9STRA
MHISTFIVAFGTAFSGIFLDLYNNANLWCWIAPLPSGCDKDSNVECERGDHAHIYRWAFYFGPLWTSLVMALVFVVYIYLEVRALEHAALVAQATDIKALESYDDSSRGFDASYRDPASYAGQEQQQEHGKDLKNNESGGDGGVKSNLQNKHKSTEQIMNQCLWYLAAFYMTHLFSTINRIIQLCQDDSYFALLVLHAIFDPLQGFLNFLVYRRPIYLRHRRLRSHLPRYKCWLLALRWHFSYDADKERRQALLSKQKHQFEEERERKRVELERQAQAAVATRRAKANVVDQTRRRNPDQPSSGAEEEEEEESNDILAADESPPDQPLRPVRRSTHELKMRQEEFAEVAKADPSETTPNMNEDQSNEDDAASLPSHVEEMLQHS